MAPQNRDVDVLVIGAGLVGAVIASELSNRGLKVAVVDALEVASGATRFALGLVTPDLSPAHFPSTARGVELLVNLARRHGLTPSLTSVLHVATAPRDASALRAQADALQSDSVKLSWETDPGIVPAGFSGGLCLQNCALVDLTMLTVRLLRQSGLVFRPHFEIQSLDSGGGSVLVMSADNTVRAGSVVLATNAYSGLLSPYLADAVRVVRGVVWRSRPKSRSEVPLPTLIDGANLVVGQGAGLRMYLAAWDWDGSHSAQLSARVHDFLETRRPDLLNETESWSATQTTVTRDGAPLVGKLSLGGAADSRVFYALGAGPYGVAWAPVMAEQVVSLVMNAGAGTTA